MSDVPSHMPHAALEPHRASEVLAAGHCSTPRPCQRPLSFYLRHPLPPSGSCWEAPCELTALLTCPPGASPEMLSAQKRKNAGLHGCMNHAFCFLDSAGEPALTPQDCPSQACPNPQHPFSHANPHPGPTPTSILSPGCHPPAPTTQTQVPGTTLHPEIPHMSQSSARSPASPVPLRENPNKGRCPQDPMPP